MFSQILFSPNGIKAEYLRVKDSILNEYCCDKSACVGRSVQAVLEETLDSSFQSVFNTVILNNNDIVKNGSAGAISQDDKTGKLSLNYALKIKYNQFFNIGASVESTEGIWNLYSKNSWQNGIALNVGYTWVPGVNGRYFEPEDCSKALTKKRAFMDSLILEYYININSHDYRT